MLEDQVDFCTKSSYRGKFNADGQMHGFGVYNFADGSVYEGDFRNGEFHGDGVITLPSNFKMRGIFVQGRCNNYHMEFGDGIEYREKDWGYCVYPDRRYALSISQGLPPVGESHETPREIPKDYYDVGEGFFNPNYDYVWTAENLTLKLRVVSPEERRWILKNCRSSKSEPVGFQQDIIDENAIALHELFGPDGPQVSCSTSTDSAETKFYRDIGDLRLSPVEISADDINLNSSQIESAVINSNPPEAAEE